MFLKKFTPEERAEYKERQKSDMNALIEKIDKGAKEVFQLEKYKEYLKFCSKFTNYSANNTILISIQKPNAKLIAGFSTWKSLGRSVNKGERGIQIIAPIKVKDSSTNVIETPITDEFGNKQYNEDGTVKTKVEENQ